MNIIQILAMIVVLAIATGGAIQLSNIRIFDAEVELSQKLQRQVKVASTMLAQSMADFDGDVYVELLTANFSTYTTPLTNVAGVDEPALPTGGYYIATSYSAADRSDVFGAPFAVCPVNNGPNTATTGGYLAGSNSTASTAFALISAGPNRQFSTTCSAAVTTGTPGGDDYVFRFSQATAESMITQWVNRSNNTVDIGAGVTSTKVAIGRAVNTSGAQLQVDQGADVTGDMSVGGTLGVAGNATVGGTLTATGGVTMNSLTVTGNAAVGGTFGAAGATTLGSTLAVTGNTTMSALTASGLASLNGGASVGGAMSVSGATTLGSTLGVSGVATFSNNLVVNGGATLNGALGVSGIANFGNTATFSGNLVANGNTTIGNATTDTLTVGANATFNGTLALADGTVAAPSLTFAMEPDLGFRRQTNRIELVNGGATRMQFSDEGITINNSRSGLPQIVLNHDTSGSDRTIRFSTGNVSRWVFGANGLPENSTTHSGSDLYIARYNHTGSYLGTAWQIARATGYITQGSTTIMAQDATNEGGQITLSDAQSAHGDVQVDNYQGLFRAFNTTRTAGTFNFTVDHAGPWFSSPHNGTLQQVWWAGNDGAGSGLDADIIDGAPTVASGAAAGQVLAWNGAQWQPATITSSGGGGGVTITETDPQVGTVNNGGWCTGNASGVVNCTSASPVPSGTANYIARFNASGVLVSANNITFDTDGEANFGTGIETPYVTYTSDERLKDWQEDISGALEGIKTLRIGTYKPSEAGLLRGMKDRTFFGVIAQDLEKVLPWAVRQDAQGWRQVDYPLLAPYALAGVQELDRKVDTRDAVIFQHLARLSDDDPTNDKLDLTQPIMIDAVDNRVDTVLKTVDEQEARLAAIEAQTSDLQAQLKEQGAALKAKEGQIERLENWLMITCSTLGVALLGLFGTVGFVLTRTRRMA